jgi:hypothetical protein
MSDFSTASLSLLRPIFLPVARFRDRNDQKAEKDEKVTEKEMLVFQHVLSDFSIFN